MTDTRRNFFPGPLNYETDDPDLVGSFAERDGAVLTDKSDVGNDGAIVLMGTTSIMGVPGISGSPIATAETDFGAIWDTDAIAVAMTVKVGLGVDDVVDYRYLISKYEDATSAWGVLLCGQGDGSSQLCVLDDIGDAGLLLFLENVQEGQILRIAATFDELMVQKLYINGVDVSGAGVTSAAALTDITGSWRIGSLDGTSNQMHDDDAITDIQVYSAVDSTVEKAADWVAADYKRHLERRQFIVESLGDVDVTSTDKAPGESLCESLRVVSADWAIEADDAPDATPGSKCIIVADSATPAVASTPNQNAFGCWEFDIGTFGTFDKIYVGLALGDQASVNGATQDGYAIRLAPDKADPVLSLIRLDDGVETDLFIGSAEADDDKWYRVRVYRDYTGEFTVWYQVMEDAVTNPTGPAFRMGTFRHGCLSPRGAGGSPWTLVPVDSGSNPVTDLTYITSQYWTRERTRGG